MAGQVFVDFELGRSNQDFHLLPYIALVSSPLMPPLNSFQARERNPRGLFTSAYIVAELRPE